MRIRWGRLFLGMLLLFALCLFVFMSSGMLSSLSALLGPGARSTFKPSGEEVTSVTGGRPTRAPVQPGAPAAPPGRTSEDNLPAFKVLTLQYTPSGVANFTNSWVPARYCAR